MKACFVKSPYDVNMIWESMRYPGEEAFFAAFGFRSIGLCLGIKFQADIWVMDWEGQDPAIFQNPFVLHKNPDMNDRIRAGHKNIVRESDIPWDEYDIVYSHYPLVSKKTILSHPEILWTYRELAHRSRRARWASAHGGPYGAYGLYLDHYISIGKRFLERLPGVVGFPYLQNPDTLRRLVQPTLESSVFIDARVLPLGTDEQNAMCGSLQSLCGLPIKFVPIKGAIFNIEFPKGRLLACREYLKRLGQSKYFLTWRGGRKGERAHVTGLAVMEAAALGLIVIANSNSKHNRKVCHPTCLIPPGGPPRKGLRIIKRIERDAGLQKEILRHQEIVIRRDYWDEPIALLHRGVEMKRDKNEDLLC